jgi:glycosyltransferase involved in cell wall biosynthesis
MSCQKITTLILAKNHEDTISSTLESVKDLGPILVADLGSKDKTPSICQEMGAKVFNTPFNYNYSAIRNNLAAKAVTEWLFWIDPGEIVSSGHEYFEAEKPDKMYRVMVLKDDLLMKQSRLFQKGAGKFTKPVFEALEPDLSEQTLPIVITGDAQTDPLTMECLMRWKDQEPLSPEPDYYIAMLHLMNRRYEQFLSAAEQFLFEKKTIDASVLLTKYYIASLVRKRNVGKALQLTLECLAACPMMAEFWCMLGDLYLFFIKEYDRAYQFYENALILGSQRLAEDTMPMEISKYDEYPRKMMDVIQNAIRKTVASTDSSHGE